jgi:hypothetical protein
MYTDDHFLYVELNMLYMESLKLEMEIDILIHN